MKPQVGLLVLLLSLVLSVVGCGDPADAHRYNSSGVKLFEQGRPEEALAEYNEAIRLNPQHPYVPLAYASRAMSYTLLGNDPEAHQDIGRAVELGYDPRLLLRAIDKLKDQR